MDLTQYVTGIGRRWKVLIACLVVALAVGWFLSPAKAASTPHGTSYQATTYLLGTSTGFGRGGSTLETVAALVTLGEVPRRVADAIGYEGDPAGLASSVQAVPDDTTQLLKITATAPTEPRAKLIADTFATELLSFLSERTTSQAQSLRHQIERIDRQVSRLSEQLPASGAGAAVGTRDVPSSPSPGENPHVEEIQAQVDALNSQRQIVQQQLTSLTTETGGHLAGYEVVEPAVAVPVAPSSGIEAPQSRAVRLGIAAAIGLLLGIALALVLERFDTRIRSKPAAEDAFGLPVLAVIPKIGRRRRRMVLTQASPHGPASNAFRLLAAALQFGWAESPNRETHDNGGPSAPRTLLVASGEPREGRSTVAANLATAFAEIGKRVIVICADFRHPTLHATFNVALEPGLAEALEGNGAGDLGSILQETAIDRVSVVATGRVSGSTTGLFGSERVHALFAKLRSSADLVIVDTSPVLAVSDWTQMIPEVDAVIVVARAGQTDAGSARRTADVLGLLKAPVVGAALNGVPRGLFVRASDRSWYRYQAPDRSQPVAPKLDPSGPVVVVTAENGNQGHENGQAEKPDEARPYLARRGTEE